MRGKNAADPIAFAAPAPRAIAATHRPIAKIAAIESTTASMNPTPLFGTLTPKAAIPTTTRMTSAIAASRRLIPICAASTHAGGTGVVDRRRRTPCSR
jgi:hypothetical protein